MYNSPPGGAINRTTTPQVTSANYDNYFISVQAVVVDPLDRLWAVDTGRAIDPTTNMLTDNTGGCKLVQLNLNNNTVARTITFPPTVCYRKSRSSPSHPEALLLTLSRRLLPQRRPLRSPLQPLLRQLLRRRLPNRLLLRRPRRPRHRRPRLRQLLATPQRRLSHARRASVPALRLGSACVWLHGWRAAAVPWFWR